MSVLRGEIYLVNLGNEPVGSEQGGTRPVLIIQNDVGNRYSPTTIVAALTRTMKECSYHVEVTPQESGLDSISMVKLEQIQTVSVTRLIKKIVELSSEKMREVDRALKVSLSLD